MPAHTTETRTFVGETVMLVRNSFVSLRVSQAYGLCLTRWLGKAIILELLPKSGHIEEPVVKQMEYQW